MLSGKEKRRFRMWARRVERFCRRNLGPLPEVEELQKDFGEQLDSQMKAMLRGNRLQWGLLRLTLGDIAVKEYLSDNPKWIFNQNIEEFAWTYTIKYWSSEVFLWVKENDVKRVVNDFKRWMTTLATNWKDECQPKDLHDFLTNFGGWRLITLLLCSDFVNTLPDQPTRKGRVSEYTTEDSKRIVHTAYGYTYVDKWHKRE